MKFSKKCDYALTVMLDLSNFYNNRRVHISDLSKRREIPPKFLGQILLLLKKEGLLKSKKGPNGGYSLIRPPKEIMVGDVIRVVEKSFFIDHPGTENAHGENGNLAGNGFFGLYPEIKAAVCLVIDNISFEDIRKREAESHEHDVSGYSYII